MSMCCYCWEPVYTAETKTYDGKTFHHGVCYGMWKKERDKEAADERNAEYYKTADVSPTKIKDPNYNTIIYATQYDPVGTQPNQTYSSSELGPPTSAEVANFSRDKGKDNEKEKEKEKDAVPALPIFPVVARQRASSFNRRPMSGTFIPRPMGDAFSCTPTAATGSSGTWTQSSTFPRSSSASVIGSARSGGSGAGGTLTASDTTVTRSRTSTGSTMMKRSPSSNLTYASGSAGSWIPPLRSSNTNTDINMSAVAAAGSGVSETTTDTTSASNTLRVDTPRGASGSWFSRRPASGTWSSPRSKS